MWKSSESAGSTDIILDKWLEDKEADQMSSQSEEATAKSFKSLIDFSLLVCV